ncbi:MAG: MFS transporter [Candidatus Saccharibacteria bacterium]
MGKRKSGDEKWYYSFLPNNMAGGSTSPLIPLFVTEGLAGTVGQVGLISALSSMASVPSFIMWGNVSDAIKRRRLFILIGFGGMALAMLMMALSMNFEQYAIANILLGLLSTAAAPVGTVLILESFKKEEWAKRLGDFSKVGGIGWVVGLVLGTVWLSTFSNIPEPALAMRALFLLAAGLSFLSMILALRWIREPDELVDRHELNGALNKVPLFAFERARYMPQRVVHVLKLSTHNLRVQNFPSSLRRYYLFTFIIFTGFLTFYVALPTYLKQYVGMSSAEVFVIYVASSAVSALTYSQAGRWASRFGSKRLQAGAIFGRIFLFPSFFLITLLGLPHAMLLAAFCILHGLLGFCWANISVSGSHIVSNICKQDCRAESTGMYNAMQGMATVAGALIGGFIAQYYGYEAMFITAPLFLVVGLLLLTRINTEKGTPGDESPGSAHV